MRAGGAHGRVVAGERGRLHVPGQQRRSHHGAQERKVGGQKNPMEGGDVGVVHKTTVRTVYLRTDAP